MRISGSPSGPTLGDLDLWVELEPGSAPLPLTFHVHCCLSREARVRLVIRPTPADGDGLMQ